MMGELLSNTLVKKHPTLILAFACVLLSTILHSCNKEDPGVFPQVSTSPVDLIARTAAGASGTIIEEGSDSITDKGFCWSLEVEPDLSDHTTENVFSDKEHMEERMRGLLPNTTYYVRAYATNSAGTVYGNEVSFTTKPADPMTLFNPDLSYGSVQDIDGNSYKTIVIGEQEWMAENLKTTRYNDGEAIPYIAMDPENWPPMTHGYSWYEDNEAVFKDIYGAYYNWYTVITEKVCPSGWHVPSDEEWKVLEMYLGMPGEEADAIGSRGSTEGSKLREAGSYNWVAEVEPGSNLSGFTGLPGGGRSNRGEFNGEGYVSDWWSVTPLSPLVNYWVWIRWLLGGYSWIGRSEMAATNHINIRCVKD